MEYMDKKIAANVIEISKYVVSNFPSNHEPNRLPKYIVSPIWMPTPESFAAFWRPVLFFLGGFGWSIGCGGLV